MVTTNPACAIYCRVSTDDQTADLQLRELRDYCERRDWKIVGEYVDTGWSGVSTKRPQLGKLMRDAAEHRFDCVMVWKLDRFGRSVANFIDHLQKLESWGIRFMAITQTIDTNRADPTSRLLMHIMAAFAEFEREMIRERVRSGIRAAQKRGVQCGRRRLIFDRSQVIQMYQHGKSIRQIAAAVSKSIGTVHAILAAAS